MGLTPGQRITKGTVYRRIPNRDGLFDYDEGVPELAAFMPRPQDRGALSAHLDEAEARQALREPRHEGFGLCALDIETITRETAGRVHVVASPTKNAPSHVQILGSTDDEIRMLLAALAEVVLAPKRPAL